MTTLWAYGDETGDRGLGPTASPIFGMAAILGDHDTMAGVRKVIRQLRADFNIPKGEVMSWKKYLKTHERRLHAFNQLGKIDTLTVLYAISKKSELAENSFATEDKQFYDFVAARMHTAVLWAARAQHADGVRIRFGHVRGVDHEHCRKFIRNSNDPNPKVPTKLEKELSWVAADRHFESEAADFYAGALKAAFWEDKYGNTDDSYLRKIWHQVRKNNLGCAVPLGLFTMPHYGVVFDSWWFACDGCPAESRYRQE